jgi:hypothetical protein
MRVIEQALEGAYGIHQPEEVVLRRLSEPFPVGTNTDPNWWYLPLGLLLFLGIVFTIWMYIRDSRRIRWYWAAPLSLMRICVYFLIALILLPAKVRWKTDVKRSSVVVLLDVSPSMTLENADPATDGGATPARLRRITDFLADEHNAFLKDLLEKNPVFVYRFGSKLDEEAQGFGKLPMKDPDGRDLVEYRPMLNITPDNKNSTKPEDYLDVWNSKDWYDFATYDLKSWLLRGVSADGREKVWRTPLFNDGDAQKKIPPKLGTPNWAQDWLAQDISKTIPDDAKVPDAERLMPADADILKGNREKLKARADVASSIITGTNVPDSLLKAIERESGNMVQGIIVFSDGRSNLGSESTIATLRTRAKNAKIPVFTVYLGEEKVTRSMRITDLQVPDQTPPDEPFKVIVEVDGEGYAGKTANVVLTLKNEEKEGAAQDFEGTVIDPAKVEDQLKSDSTKLKELIEGKKWSAIAKATVEEKKGPGGKVDRIQASSEKSIFKIEKKPLRTLMIASAGNRDFQFLFNQLTRDNADLSLFLQNDAGKAGNASLLDDPKRLLNRFPDRIRVEEDVKESPDEHWYNLANYDIIIAFDPDWSEFTEVQISNIRTWIDLQAGAFLLVSGPLHTKKITYNNDQPKYGPLLDILPVVPGDYDLKMLSRDPKDPHRLVFPATAGNTDFLKLDDRREGPLAGWDRFFYGREDPSEDARVIRGFFNYYPVKDVKVGANVIARFDDGGQARENTFDKKDPPYLVTYKYGQGMSAFLGSSEMWRLRKLSPEGHEFYERFWTKLTRYLTSGSRKKQNRRGRLLMSQYVSSGSYIRPRAELLDPGLKPIPENSDPPIRIRPIELDQTSYPKEVLDVAKRKSAGPGKEKEDDFDSDAFQKAKEKYHQQLTKNQHYRMSPAKGDGMDKGWFQLQVLADDKFPPGQWVIEVPIPSSSELLRSKFIVRSTNPELDNLKPDVAAMAKMADEFSEIENRLLEKPAVMKLLRDAAYSGKEGSRLAFSFDRKEAINAIPECMETKEDPQNPVSWVMLVCIGLFSVEWLTRKLLKLA